MKILFLHGWQSVPGGVKPTFLAQHGHTVINPKLPDDDFAGSCPFHGDCVEGLAAGPSLKARVGDAAHQLGLDRRLDASAIRSPSRIASAGSGIRSINASPMVFTS